jgi:choline monooxygenase
MTTLENVIGSYDSAAPLAEAYTLPGSWYFHPGVAELERRTVFGGTWQKVGRVEQVAKPGQFITVEIAGEPVVVVRGADAGLRAFFNVCRHHATAVVSEPAGEAAQFRCPYHGWTYSTEGALKGMTEFEGVCNFDRAQNGLVPVRVDTWENFVFVNLDAQSESLASYVRGLAPRTAKLQLGALHFLAQRRWIIDCNWKVYVDNFLDGGYHVPHMHKGLNSVLNYTQYTIENDGRACIQSTPLRTTEQSDATAASTRTGDYGYYFWLYPNFMINWYAGLMDTNLVLPRGTGQCEVIFDYYFADVSPAAEKFNQDSMAVADRVQDEDIIICDSVQRGLHSRAYQAGRLSVRREAGEHLFHRLLHADLQSGLASDATASVANTDERAPFPANRR